MEHRCFLTGRHRVILFKGALRHMFEECLLDYLGNTIVFISWTACGILKCKMKYFTCSWSGFQMFNKQGMVFYLASTILTNGQYPYIYSSAVVKQCVYNRFTNCHTYYLFISGQKPKTYQSSDWKNSTIQSVFQSMSPPASCWTWQSGCPSSPNIAT